ncbi:MAG TPA: hypothetical protein PKM65_16110 [Spirochaetota bacterium]|nr:hypothetical protein [Spirochaetota bacterium]HNT11821.1 hypothetical protein [Spirochaetota bacterium]HNV48686.1 hypothetical protein [Spirochaetota bacterium]HOS38557.1 hypothetical protein [Spirochaetota bacterium]HPU88806.1 hypothetical protein [Spirochaetota bacterium]
MIIAICIVVLLLSFGFHLFFLMQYVVTKDTRQLRRFVNTAISNIVIAGGVTILVLFRPDLIRSIDVDMLLWMITGAIMVMMVTIKVTIVRNIMQRAKDPAFFHYNYFGKKILDPGVVKPGEVMVFMLTMPFFLLAGAYFVARIVNWALKI